MIQRYGINIIKKGISIPSQERDYLLRSEEVLLKIHKKGSIHIRTITGAGTATIRYDDLKKRPIVLCYIQRFNLDGSVDNSYHLMDFSYFGATQIGEYYVSIYNDHCVITVTDGNPNIAGTADIYGYFYIFKEGVDG